MANLLNLLNEIAEQYAIHRNIQLHNLLGYGNDGAVWETNENTAIKVLMRQDSYDRELAAYIRLQERKVISIGNYSIPELLGFDDTRLVIEMSVVSPPFVIDFAKSNVNTECARHCFCEALSKTCNSIYRLLVHERVKQ